jgi:hypothetical protein
MGENLKKSINFTFISECEGIKIGDNCQARFNKTLKVSVTDTSALNEMLKRVQHERKGMSFRT